MRRCVLGGYIVESPFKAPLVLVEDSIIQCDSSAILVLATTLLRWRSRQGWQTCQNGLPDSK